MRFLRDVTVIEWLIVLVIIGILAAVVVSAGGRKAECDALLASSRTYKDSIDVRLACNVRSGYRSRY